MQRNIKIEYHDIYTLSLSEFIRILATDDYSHMVKDGKYDEQAAKKHWSELYMNYYSLISEYPKFKEYFALYKNYCENISRYMTVKMSYFALSNGYNQEACDALKMLGYSMKFKRNEHLNNHNELKKLESHLKNTVIMLNEAFTKLQEHLKSNDKTNIEQQFSKLLAAVSKYSGHSIPLNISVYQFTGYLNNYYNGN